MSKVLIVITKAEVGGAQAFVLNLAKSLKQSGNDIIVGFGEGEFLKTELEKINIPYKIFPSLKRTRNPFTNFKFISEIKRFVEKEKIDVVHFNSTNSLFGAIGAKQAENKPKTIFTFHGLSVLDPNHKSFFKLAYWAIFKYLLMYIDKAVFVSQNNLEYAKKIKITNKGEVIYNGLDLKDADFLNKEESVSFLESQIKTNLKDKHIIGSIGRLAYPKNYEFLINAFPAILETKPNAVSIIIGDGPERSKYESLIKNNGSKQHSHILENVRMSGLDDKIYLTGEIKDASKYLKAFDVFVLPSIYEGLSISLIETLFAQVPALASDVGGNAEILGEKNVYQSGDQKDFLAKLKNIQSSAKQSTEFNTDQMVKKYLSIYE